MGAWPVEHPMGSREYTPVNGLRIDYVEQALVPQCPSSIELADVTGPKTVVKVDCHRSVCGSQ